MMVVVGLSFSFVTSLFWRRRRGCIKGKDRSRRLRASLIGVDSVVPLPPPLVDAMGGVGFSVRPDRSRSGGFEVATPGPDPAMTSSSSSQTGLRPSPCWRRRLGSSLKSKMRHDRQWLGC
jgi:hypothetical protein